MSPKPLSFRVVFSTPWFSVEESIPERPGELPYYRMTGPDGVICWPFTVSGDILLIRQYRPNLDRFTMELPAGSIDGHETIIEAAAREIREETGHACGDLGLLAPGRLHLNRGTHIEHLVLAFDARPIEQAVVEAGIEPVIVTRADFRKMVQEDRIEQVVALSFLGLAAAKLGVDMLQDPIDLIHERMRDEVERGNRDGRQQD